mmetsp:Transcript_4533/g.8632  ORF Transcript_4533/g.8632 Transcript_4533/m.8632 type:complete len:1300 (+) Transcript_4533:89-3988(+)
MSGYSSGEPSAEDVSSSPPQTNGRVVKAGGPKKVRPSRSPSASGGGSSKPGTPSKKNRKSSRSQEKSQQEEPKPPEAWDEVEGEAKVQLFNAPSMSPIPSPDPSPRDQELAPEETGFVARKSKSKRKTKAKKKGSRSSTSGGQKANSNAGQPDTVPEGTETEESGDDDKTAQKSNQMGVDPASLGKFAGRQSLIDQQSTEKPKKYDPILDEDYASETERVLHMQELDEIMEKIQIIPSNIESDQERVDLLSATFRSHFKRLPITIKDCWGLGKLLTIIRVEAGEFIMHKGERSSFMGLVLQGQFKYIMPFSWQPIERGNVVGQFENGETIRQGDLYSSTPAVIAILSFRELRTLKENRSCARFVKILGHVFANSSIRKLRKTDLYSQTASSATRANKRGLEKITFDVELEEELEDDEEEAPEDKIDLVQQMKAESGQLMLESLYTYRLLQIRRNQLLYKKKADHAARDLDFALQHEKMMTTSLSEKSVKAGQALAALQEKYRQLIKTRDGLENKLAEKTKQEAEINKQLDKSNLRGDKFEAELRSLDPENGYLDLVCKLLFSMLSPYREESDDDHGTDGYTPPTHVFDVSMDQVAAMEPNTHALSDVISKTKLRGVKKVAELALTHCAAHTYRAKKGGIVDLATVAELEWKLSEAIKDSKNSQKQEHARKMQAQQLAVDLEELKGTLLHQQRSIDRDRSLKQGYRSIIKLLSITKLVHSYKQRSLLQKCHKRVNQMQQAIVDDKNIPATIRAEMSGVDPTMLLDRISHLNKIPPTRSADELDIQLSVLCELMTALHQSLFHWKQTYKSFFSRNLELTTKCEKSERDKAKLDAKLAKRREADQARKKAADFEKWKRQQEETDLGSIIARKRKECASLHFRLTNLRKMVRALEDRIRAKQYGFDPAALKFDTSESGFDASKVDWNKIMGNAFTNTSSKDALTLVEEQEEEKELGFVNGGELDTADPETTTISSSSSSDEDNERPAKQKRSKKNKATEVQKLLSKNPLFKQPLSHKGQFKSSMTKVSYREQRHVEHKRAISPKRSYYTDESSTEYDEYSDDGMLQTYPPSTAPSTHFPSVGGKAGRKPGTAPNGSPKYSSLSSHFNTMGQGSLPSTQRSYMQGQSRQQNRPGSRSQVSDHLNSRNLRTAGTAPGTIFEGSPGSGNHFPMSPEHSSEMWDHQQQQIAQQQKQLRILLEHQQSLQQQLHQLGEDGEGEFGRSASKNSRKTKGRSPSKKSPQSRITSPSVKREGGSFFAEADIKRKQANAQKMKNSSSMPLLPTSPANKASPLTVHITTPEQGVG